MIDSTKLKYKKFIDPRSKAVKGFTEGFSGELLLGTATNGNKYIIKHTEMTDAGNEFVASVVARKMGIPVAKAHLPLSCFSERWKHFEKYMKPLTFFI